MTIHTAASIRAARRAQDRRRAAAARVITAMSRGATMNLTFMRGRSVFALSNGELRKHGLRCVSVEVEETTSNTGGEDGGRCEEA
jgi:hypothetical protein